MIYYYELFNGTVFSSTYKLEFDIKGQTSGNSGSILSNSSTYLVTNFSTNTENILCTYEVMSDNVPSD